MTTLFDTYISKIESDLRGGKATELTYRSTLESFMESLERGIEASNDPKHIECGAPDFIVEKRKVPLGYVETKDVGVDLNKIEKSDQMKRYLNALNNLILTDYLEFRWYVNGEKKRAIRIAEIGKGNRLAMDAQAETNLNQFFHDFFATESPTVSTPKELAIRLSGVTHFIREQIIAVLKSGDPALQSAFQKRFGAFKDLLLPALKEDEFADLYAQTMTYGLFAAKLSAPENANFTLAGAYQFLFGNKFLRRLFSDVSEELDEIEIIRPYLLDIVSLLNRADFASILADFGKRTRTSGVCAKKNMLPYVITIWMTLIGKAYPHLPHTIYLFPKTLNSNLIMKKDGLSQIFSMHMQVSLRLPEMTSQWHLNLKHW